MDQISNKQSHIRIRYWQELMAYTKNNIDISNALLHHLCIWSHNLNTVTNHTIIDK